MINFVTVEISDDCKKCFECVKNCPTGALTLERGIFMHNAYACAYDEYCMDICPNGAITIKEM